MQARRLRSRWRLEAARHRGRRCPRWHVILLPVGQAQRRLSQGNEDPPFPFALEAEEGQVQQVLDDLADRRVLVREHIECRLSELEAAENPMVEVLVGEEPKHYAFPCCSALRLRRRSRMPSWSKRAAALRVDAFALASFALEPGVDVFLVGQVI